MRRHRSSSAGITSTSARPGAFGRFTLAAALCALAALTLSATASALPVEVPAEGFAAPGAGRIAVDEATGDLYVINAGDNRVDKYSPAGILLDELEVPVGEGGFEFEGENADIAVDNTGTATQGRVYVANGNFPGKAVAFDSSGSFSWQTAGAGLTACGISVDPSGTPLFSEYSETHKLDPTTGTPAPTGIVLGSEPVCQLAFDSDGGLVGIVSGSEPHRYDSTTGAELFQYLPGRVSADVAVDGSSHRVLQPSSRPSKRR